jgi:hypothetical protein
MYTLNSLTLAITNVNGLIAANADTVTVVALDHVA